MKTLLQRQWQEGGWLTTLLAPLGWLARAVVAAKRVAYRRGWRRATRVGVPVVVVGNLYVGGTGKTPFILAAIDALRDRGWHPGVISRGYGIDVGPAPRVGTGQLEAVQFGDEPALIARNGGAPVAIHPRRALAAQALLAAHPEVDVILADDGLQHLALARDVEIVLQDLRGIGNGALLPAGPLREPPSRLASVDAVVTNLTGGTGADTPAGAIDIPRQATMRLEIRVLRRLVDGVAMAPSALPPQARIAAAAGIGHPERFFTTLRQAGIEPGATLALPDHYDFAETPFSGLDAEYILVTEKDAVKCQHLNDPRLWAVTVSATLSDPFFFDWLDTRLHGRTPA